MSEQHEQAAVIAWAAYQERRVPELKLLHHIPNGGHRHKRTAAKLKAQGVRPGVPDLYLPVARGEHHGLYLELKTNTGTLSPKQRWWHAQLKEQGYKVLTVRSALEAITELRRYLAAPQGPQGKPPPD